MGMLWTNLTFWLAQIGLITLAIKNYKFSVQILGLVEMQKLEGSKVKIILLFKCSYKPPTIHLNTVK